MLTCRVPGSKDQSSDVRVPPSLVVKGRGATVLRPKYGHGLHLSRPTSVFCKVEECREMFGVIMSGTDAWTALAWGVE